MSLSLIISSVGDTALAGGVLFYAVLFDDKELENLVELYQRRRDRSSNHRHYNYKEFKLMKNKSALIFGQAIIHTEYLYMGADYTWNLSPSERLDMKAAHITSLRYKLEENCPYARDVQALYPAHVLHYYGLSVLEEEVLHAGHPVVQIGKLNANLTYPYYEQESFGTARSAYGIESIFASRTVDHVTRIYKQGPLARWHQKAILRHSPRWLMHKQFSHLRQFRYSPPSWWRDWFPSIPYTHNQR